MVAPPPAPVRPASSAVEVDVQLQPIDLYRAERTIVWRQLRLILIVGTFSVVLRVLAGAGVSLLISVATVGSFCFAALNAFMYMAARSTLKTNRMLSGPLHYSFEPAGIIMRGSTYWGWQDWSNLHDTLETPQLFILRASTSQRNVIPKRCLAPGDLERLRALARPDASGIPGARPEAREASPSRFTIRVRMTADDLYRGFVTLLLRKSYWYAAQMVFAFLLIFALHPTWLTPTTFIVVGSIYVFYIAAFTYWSSARAIRTNAAYRNELQFSFDESGLEASGPTMINRHNWCNFQSALEDSKMFLFCPSNSQILVVPKRFFANHTQIETLRQLLRAHFTGKLSLKR